MAGRALPDAFTWSSLPPAPSLSLVWGAGGCELRHPGPTLALGPGEAMWIDAGHPHRGLGHAGSDFITLFVPAWTDDHTPTGAHAFTPDPRLTALLLRVAATLLDGAPDRDAIDALHRHRDALRPARHTRRRVAPGTLKRALAALDDGYAAGVDLPDLARAARLSAPHLSRSFGHHLGISPIQYRKQLRLLGATRALLTGASVTTAALTAGFADTAHFSRTFRAQYGIPPSEWQARVAPVITPSGPPMPRAEP